MKLDNIIATRAKKTVYRDGELCIKLFDNDFSKSDILNEALNQARVEETGLNIPAIRDVCTIDGKWAIVSDHISGKTLQALMDENPAKLDEYLSLFVDLQLEVTSHKCPLLTKIKDKMRRKINMTELHDNVKFSLLSVLEGMPKHDKLCHGDFNPSNIIMGDDGKAYIIDWSHATQGNASADAARTYLLFKLSGDDMLAEKYLDLFCEKSKTAKKYVQKWMPIVAASQSVKGNENERQFLLSWVDVADYE